MFCKSCCWWVFWSVEFCVILHRPADSHFWPANPWNTLHILRQIHSKVCNYVKCNGASVFFQLWVAPAEYQITCVCHQYLFSLLDQYMLMYKLCFICIRVSSNSNVSNVSNQLSNALALGWNLKPPCLLKSSATELILDYIRTNKLSNKYPY